MDPVVVNIAVAVVVSGLIALIAFAIAWWPIKGKPCQEPATESPRDMERRWLAPVVLASVSVVGYILLNRGSGSTPSLMPGPSYLTLWPTITVSVVVLALAGNLVPVIASLAITMRLALYAGLTALAMRGQLRQMDSGSIIVLLGGAALYTLLMAVLLEYAGRRQRGPVGPMTGVIVAGGASQVIVLGFSTQTPAFLVACLAAVMGAATIVSFFRPRLSVAYGGMAILGVLISVALIQAAIFGQAKGQYAVAYLALILASAASPWLVDVVGVPDRLLGHGWTKGVLKLGLAGAFAGAATGLAFAVMTPAY